MDFQGDPRRRPLPQGLKRVPKLASLLLRLLRRRVPRTRPVCWKCARHLGDIITIDTLQGLMSVHTRDTAIGRSLFLQGQYELDLVGKVKELLGSIGSWSGPEGATLIDVGSNIGIIAVGLTRDGFVDSAIAVEPEPRNHFLLQENIRLNALDKKVIPIQKLVSSGESELRFELSKSNYGDHRVRLEGVTPKTKGRYDEDSRETIVIPCTTLDSIEQAYLGGKPTKSRLLWIDVQGHEGYVFEGGSRFLRGGVPTVSEIWPYGILRSGMALEQFRKIVANIWTEYWVLRRNRFVRYPIDSFSLFLHELGSEGDYDNAVFTRLATG